MSLLSSPTYQQLTEASNNSTFKPFKLQFMLMFSPTAPLMHWCVIIYAVFTCSFLFFSPRLWLIFFPQLIFPRYFDGERKQAAFYDFTAIINPLYELEAGEQPAENWLTEVTNRALRANDLWAPPSGPPPPCARPSWCNSGVGCHFPVFPLSSVREDHLSHSHSVFVRYLLIKPSTCVTLHFFLWVCLVFVVLRVKADDEIKWYSTQNPSSIKHAASDRSLVSTLMKNSKLISVTDGGFINSMKAPRHPQKRPVSKDACLHQL